jgi:hypothetical protein
VILLGENTSTVIKAAEFRFLQASKESKITCCGTGMRLCKSGRNPSKYVKI